jgi:hypothetical protein
MTIYECSKCKHRYGQIVGQQVSSCPKCKSEERAELALEYQPPKVLDYEQWMDLWRFARPAEQRFVEIVTAGQAAVVTSCPECEVVGFIHRPGCTMKRLCDVEILALNQGLEAGRVNYYLCDTCLGKIYTIDLHAGVSPMFLTKCRGSIGCGGTMRSGMFKVPPDVEGDKIEWAFRRPANVQEFDADMADRVLEKGQLVLERLKGPVP